MKKYRILSAFLAVLMLCGTLSVLPVGAIPVVSVGGSSEDGSANTAIDYTATINGYLNTPMYKTPQEKLASMKMMWEKHGYQLWADEITGEVATVKVATGEILFTNPWNISDSKTQSANIKQQLLSQVIISYKDIVTGSGNEMNSCKDAAMNGQIKVKYIKNGIRVEYSIGRDNSRFLVPMRISVDSMTNKLLLKMRQNIDADIQYTVVDKLVPANEFEVLKKKYPNAVVGQTYSYYELIEMHDDDNDPKKNFTMDAPFSWDFDHQKIKDFFVYYTLCDPFAEDVSEKEIADMQSKYPVTKKMAIYVFDEAAKNTEIIRAERTIKTWAPTYTFEDLDNDHLETDYAGVAKAPPIFKLALEYTLDQNGMTVRLPANGIRFDESLYRLEHIYLLPYMGAGTSENGGYNFFPDGSGTLFGYEDLIKNGDDEFVAQIYGDDYAYHKLTGIKNRETVRYPVFGTVEHWKGYKTVTDYTRVLTPAEYDENGNLISEAVYATKIVETEEDRGYLAIIEEGDSMTTLHSTHMNQSSSYTTLKMKVTPRPTDSYNMSDAISVGSNTEWTVVSSRKYVGNYKIRYIMLSDDELAKENKLASYYECTWVGMATAYREYLERIGTLERLTEENVDVNIPLYIETFGAINAVEKILSIPVDVMKPLTTFDDIKTMYKELSDAIEEQMKELSGTEGSVATGEANYEKFSNINFKLTGYANGGMYATMPYHLNWEEVLGGAAGFEELVKTSKDEGFGIFPDFDFAYINQDVLFDGVILDAHAVKTIDNRYTARREYDATYQSYVGYYELAISPAFFARFITKLSINYMKYNPTGISVSSLGTALNSDFDEEDPYNRADAQNFTVEALRKLSMLKNADGDSMHVMTSGGNAYTWKYIDHLINAPLDSSRYSDSRNTVPFIGVVLHGYMQYAGTPINEQGNLGSALLRAIENGSGLFFKLSYQNTEELKEWTELSHNYSIRYDIWKEDVVDMYVTLNNLLSDLQTKLIVDHEFLKAERIPDADEAENDEKLLEEIAKLEEAQKLAEKAAEDLRAALALRKTPGIQADVVAKALKNAADQVVVASKAAAKIEVEGSDYVGQSYELLKEANSAFELVDAKYYELYNEAAYANSFTSVKTQINNIVKSLLDDQLDGLLSAALAELSDATLSSAFEALAADVKARLMNVIAEAGSAAAVEKAFNEEPEYLTSAEEAAAAVAESEAIVNAVMAAVAAEMQSIKSELVGAELIAFAQDLFDAANVAIADAINVDTVPSFINAAVSGYNKVVEDNEKLVNQLLVLLNKAEASVQAAVAAGATREGVMEAYALHAALEAAKNASKAAESAAKNANLLYNSALTAAYRNETNAAEVDAKIQAAVELLKNGSDTSAVAEKFLAAAQALINKENAQTAQEDAAKALADAQAAYDAGEYTALVANAKKAENDAFEEYKKLQGTANEVRDAAILREKMFNAKAKYDLAQAEYEAILAETESSLGTTSAELALLKEKREARDAAKESYDSLSSSVKDMNIEGVYLTAVETYEARIKAEALKKAVDTAISDMVKAEEKRADLLNVANGALITEIADLAFAANSKLTVFNTDGDVIRASVTAMLEAYNVASEALLEAEEALLIAGEAVEALKAKYEAAKNDSNASDAEKARTEQFYNAGKKFFDEAEANYGEITKRLERIEAYITSSSALKARVLVFGTTDIEADLATVLDAIADINEALYDSTMGLTGNLSKIVIAKAELESAKAAYDAAKAEYEELVATKLDGLTEEELSALKSETLVAAYKMSTAEKAITTAQEALNAAKLLFNRSYETLVSAVEAMGVAADDASGIYLAAELLSKSNAEAKDACDFISAKYDIILARSLEIMLPVSDLMDVAFESGLIDENGDLIVESVEEAPVEDEEKSEFDEQRDAIFSKYVYDDGSVVAVTYGGKNGNDSEAYRTFILNYNSFSVKVTYNEVEYEIAGYGYAVINH